MRTHACGLAFDARAALRHAALGLNKQHSVTHTRQPRRRRRWCGALGVCMCVLCAMYDMCSHSVHRLPPPPHLRTEPPTAVHSRRPPCAHFRSTRLGSAARDAAKTGENRKRGPNNIIDASASAECKSTGSGVVVVGVSRGRKSAVAGGSGAAFRCACTALSRTPGPI